mmetsp:Transcript_25957/g.44147  ORF Transcript_25957/g.44147 Transcript_25957/m.44147 type:complete len:91 (+) Transcript_25957:212-484(+)
MVQYDVRSFDGGTVLSHGMESRSHYAMISPETKHGMFHKDRPRHGRPCREVARKHGLHKTNIACCALGQKETQRWVGIHPTLLESCQQTG